MPKEGPDRRLRRSLLASTSLAALLAAASVSPAAAACTPAGSPGYTNTAVAVGVCVSNTSFSGSIYNIGTISPSGITFTNGQISGVIFSSGEIDGGISLDATSAIITGNVSGAVQILSPTFTGGITNQGSISGGVAGVYVTGSTSFSGGISNSGTIAGSSGISVSSVSSFSGGITNSGTISAALSGISVQSVSSFSGNISNSGTITAATGIHIIGSTIAGAIVDSGVIQASTVGIAINNTSQITSTGNAISVTGPTFTGGISNAGMVSGGGAGIFINGVSTFSGGISNSGTISAVNAGIRLQSVTTFAGNISNSGTITGATGINITGSTIAGSIADSGTINASTHGIVIDNASKITSTGNAVSVTGPTFTGGISNAGVVSAGAAGIVINGISTFSGGISNSGMISAVNAAIRLQSVTTFSGNISNAGAITGATGISVSGSTIAGSIADSGTINASTHGITIDGTSKVNSTGNAVSVTGPTFTSGISNAGVVSAGAAGIVINGISTFSGGISNSGTISAVNAAIRLQSVTTFSGNISNAGAITGATGISVSGSTITGAIVDSGTINASTHGIVIDNASKMNAAGNAIAVTGPTFTGGISNAGSISAGGYGIYANNLSTFSGGISNSGTLSASSRGIFVNSVTSFSGGISNSGTISAAGNAIHIASVSTFAGGISNSGTINGLTGIDIASGAVFAAGSAIVDSGTISGSAAAIDVSSATSPVTITQNAGLISGAIKLSTNADVLNVNGGAINGNIVGQGSANTLNFALGSGSFTYGSAYGFSGLNQVNINSGTVILNGTNSAGTVTVNGGVLQVGDASNTGAALTSTNPIAVYGTLAGHGTVNSNVAVQSGGTLNPGGSIGTLTINGNLTLNSGSFYAVEISPTQSSTTQVNGSATLGGATVVATLTGQFGLYASRNYTILTTTIPLGSNNTFNPAVTISQSGLTNAQRLVVSGGTSLTYGTNTGILSLTLPVSTPGSSTASDLTVPGYAILLALPSNAQGNAQNVTAAINNFILKGGTLPSGFQNLSGFSGAALSNAVNQLAGQTQGSFAPTSFGAGSSFLNQMLNPYIEGRGMSGGFNPDAASPVMGYAPEPALSPAASAFSALVLPPRAAFEPRLSLWATGYGGSGTISGNAATGSASTASQIYGAVTGADYRVTPDTMIGVALGGGGSSWSLGQGMGGGNSSQFQAGVYGSAFSGPVYVSGALSYALQDVKTYRDVTLAGDNPLHGSFASNGVSGRIETGYHQSYGGVAVTPYGALQTQALFLPSYSEYAGFGSPQFALSYQSHTYSATRTELGAWFDSGTWIGDGIKLYSRVAWAHDFDNEGSSTAFFQSLPGETFLINSAKPARDGALVTAGFEYKIGQDWSIIGKFDGEFSGTTTLYSGTGTIKKVW